MLDRPVREVMERRHYLALTSETTVGEAARLMAAHRTGAALVVDEGRLVGIFTERDALMRVLACDLDPRTTTIAAVMTREPRTVGPGETYGYALILMQEGGFRHAPVVEDGRPIGIVSSRNAMDPELEEFQAESNRREQLRAGH